MDKKKWQCEGCKQQRARRCEQDGFQNFKKPKFHVSDGGQHYTFCPGKATWYDEIAEIFQQCMFAVDTGILPEEGSFHDQSELFVVAYPDFVRSWNERRYKEIWSDVIEFSAALLKVIFGKGK